MQLPHDERLRWLVKTSAWVIERGGEPVRGLVEPTAKHFPDVFDGSAKAVHRLLRRVLGHAGLDDLDVGVQIVTPEGGVASSGCSSGACAAPASLGPGARRVSATPEGGYVVTLAAGELGHPLVLTTGLVRSVATLYLMEADALKYVDAREREATVDVAGTMLGFGVLLANGSHIVTKGCGGMKVHSATTLPTDELVVALALFCAAFEIAPAECARHLDGAVREPFAAALRFSRANASLAKRLRAEPSSLAEGAFALRKSEGLLGRLFGRGEVDAEEALAKELPRGTRDPSHAARAAKMRELAGLFDDA